MLLVLQHRRPDGDIDAYHLKPVRRYHIGRGSTCEIRILDLKMSRQHAAIEYVDGAWRLIDLGSMNGCLVDGQPIPGGTPLTVGMALDIGSSHLVIEHIGEVAPAVRAMRTPVPAEVVTVEEPDAAGGLPRQPALSPLPVRDGEVEQESSEDLVDTVGVAPRAIPVPPTPKPTTDQRPYIISILGVRIGPIDRELARELKARELKGVLRPSDLDGLPRA